MNEENLKFVFSEKPSLEDIRCMMESFTSERDWDQFHTPRNIMLALVGEVGELAELFQWKGDDNESITNWPIKEKEHLEEELSDVLLYLIRLADICTVDLSKAADCLTRISNDETYEHVGHDMHIILNVKGFSTHPHLEDIRKRLSFKKEYQSPRNLLFAIVSTVGRLSELFEFKSDAKVSNPAWGCDTLTFAERMIAILLHLIRLAEKCNIDLPKAVLRKYDLNVKKYPVSLVKGSSKKHTEYTSRNNDCA